MTDQGMTTEDRFLEWAEIVRKGKDQQLARCDHVTNAMQLAEARLRGLPLIKGEAEHATWLVLSKLGGVEFVTSEPDSHPVRRFKLGENPAWVVSVWVPSVDGGRLRVMVERFREEAQLRVV